jgi:GDPmannose 4,6-dehydratase
VEKVMILGITGQDGILLSKLLRSKGIDFFGVITPKTSLNGLKLLASEIPDCNLIQVSSFSKYEFSRVLKSERPSQIYNFAAISSVKFSFDFPDETFEVNHKMFCDLTETSIEFDNNIRIFQSSSSEMFGNTKQEFQDENTSFSPVSPYGESKLLAHLAAREYRQHGAFVTAGILFNHESEYRREGFLIEKIVRFMAARSLGDKKPLEIGALNISRDWSYAGDIVRGAYMSLQIDVSHEFVFATGETKTISEAIKTSLEIIEDNSPFSDFLILNPDLKRPAEKLLSRGDYSKANRILGWHPEMTFEQMLRHLIDHKKAQLK